MIIDANTKIAAILKENSRALDAIISIDPKFERLRNPLLRRIMAGRTSLAMASKFGGCNLEDFFSRLEPLGFVIDREKEAKSTTKEPVPDFIKSLQKELISEMDVRPLISSGKDPLNQILGKIQSLPPGGVLKIINSFEPTPLILLLQKKGFETFTDHLQPDLVVTYFSRKKGHKIDISEARTSDDWEEILRNFEGRIKKIDVRQLEMPLPMHTILEDLDHLSDGSALFVVHKRIPVFLLPEITERGFQYRIREIAEGEVHLIIFKV